MPTLSSAATWRTHPHRVKGYLCVYNPPVVFSCSVNQADFTYPVAQLTYDGVTVGAYTDVVVGMTVRFRSLAGAVVGYARVRLTPTSSILYIGATPSGDVTFEDDDVIEVLDDYRPWSKVPRIDASTPLAVQFYKDYNLTYSNQGTYPNPVANPGPHVAGFVEDDGYLYVPFFGETNSYPLAFGSIIASDINDIIDGEYVTGGVASGDFVARFPPGERWCMYTVTDSNGKNHTAKRFIKACERTGVNAPIPAKLASLRLSMEGADADFTILASDAGVDVIPPNSLVIYFEEETYGTTAGSLNALNYTDSEYTAFAGVKFVGWTTGVSENINPETDDMTLRASGPLGILRTMPFFSQSLEFKASPTAWHHLADLSLWRMIWYLLHWHTTVLDVCDVLRPDWYDGYLYHRFDISAGDVYGTINTLAQYVNANMCADKGGTIMFPRNAQYMLDADRDLVTTTVQLADSDWANISIEQSERDIDYWVRGSGLLASYALIKPFLSIAPGKSPGQGGVEDSFDNQLVIDQTDLNVRTGRHYGVKNTRYPSVSMTILNAGLVADPGWGEWIEFNLGPEHSKREITIND